jgi:hypothetical protein
MQQSKQFAWHVLNAFDPTGEAKKKAECGLQPRLVVGEGTGEPVANHGRGIKGEKFRGGGGTAGLSIVFSAAFTWIGDGNAAYSASVPISKAPGDKPSLAPISKIAAFQALYQMRGSVEVRITLDCRLYRGCY